MRTLLAEPDPVTRSDLAGLLEECGHPPGVLDDGSRVAAGPDPDETGIVVLGPGFEPEDRLALCAGLKAKTDRYVPVVCLGREEAPRAWVDALDGGADDYFTMPVQAETLGARLRSLGRVKVLNEELRHLARVQEQIVYTMSHDIQTPLVGIRGAVQNLRRGLVGPVSDEQREYLQLVEDAARRLSEQTESACRSARRRKQPGEAVLEPVDLRKAAETAIAGLRPAMVRRHLRVQLDAAPGIPLALGDRSSLVRVLSNLLDNAVKFSPEKGLIRVELSAWKKEEDYRVLATVSDEGRGIPAEDCERVFDRSYRWEDSGRQESWTTGLGLALCRERVEGMGGRIWLESDGGQGARFHVLMPAALSKRGGA